MERTGSAIPEKFCKARLNFSSWSTDSLPAKKKYIFTFRGKRIVIEGEHRVIRKKRKRRRRKRKEICTKSLANK
jgi:hypothetical protein